MSQHQSSAILFLLSQPSAPSPVPPAKAGIFVGSPCSPHRGAGRAARVQRWRDLQQAASRQRHRSCPSGLGLPCDGDSAHEAWANRPAAPALAACGAAASAGLLPAARSRGGRTRPGRSPREAPQLGRQTRSSALEGEKPAQRSHRGPAASSAGRAASCGQQRPASTSASPSPALRPPSNPQAALLTENIAHMFVVSKCPFSVLGHF